MGMSKYILDDFKTAMRDPWFILITGWRGAQWYSTLNDKIKKAGPKHISTIVYRQFYRHVSFKDLVYETKEFGKISVDKAKSIIENRYKLDIEEHKEKIKAWRRQVRLNKKVSRYRTEFDELKSKVVDSRSFPPAMRMAIFQRDGYKCVYCGNGPHNGYEIEADHIEEWEDGGVTSYENGQTLCRQCNSGKYHVKNIKRKAGIA